MVDPTKLCVAYAMRIGLVEQTTWQDVINTAMRRPSRRVVWTKPDAPVFFAWTKSQRLDFEKPAGIDQQRRFLCDAADLVGMTQVPITHDIRRGAASDIFHLQTDAGDTNSVRRTLGHSMSAMNRGTTDEYIGRSKGDSWSARLDAEKDADPFGVQRAAEPFKKRKVRTEDIDKYCVDNHLDKKGMNRGTTDNYIGRTRGDSYVVERMFRGGFVSRGCVVLQRVHEESLSFPACLTCSCIGS
jgi:hypothetical protein